MLVILELGTQMRRVLLRPLGHFDHLIGIVLGHNLDGDTDAARGYDGGVVLEYERREARVICYADSRLSWIAWTCQKINKKKSTRLRIEGSGMIGGLVEAGFPFYPF